MNVDSSSPQPIRRPPQMSLSFMMLMMVIFALMSAGLFYASQVPAVQEEISVLVGEKADVSGESVGRMSHIIFIMFTFTSPLLLAGFLSIARSLFLRMGPPQSGSGIADE